MTDLDTSQDNRLKWSKLTKGTEFIVIHAPPSGKTIPNASPYVMKVLTFLRMARIPYKIDYSDPFGAKGKSPWMSIDGENIDDSEFIIDYLKRKYDDYLKAKYTDEQLAVATAVRIMLEEHTNWGLALQRMVYGQRENLQEVVKVPTILIPIFNRVIKSRAVDQGIGLHSQQEILRIIKKDLRNVSNILGGKSFICGSLPCVEDAAIFGQLAQYYWGLPNSPYKKLLNGQLSNLRDYCGRMREIYWPEWNV